MANTKTRTGKTAPTSGQYSYNRGRHEITLSKGERVPPTRFGATTFTLVDKTKHKGGK